MEEKFNFFKNEEKILKFWKRNKIFEKSLKQRMKSPHFVFFEGPPTANGKPGIHHVLSRSFKDAVCRFRTMAGFYVKRRAGWDTHGLPVELEVEKQFGFKSKSDIERFGISEFNKKCKENVWKYKQEWDKLTERIAFWLDLKNPYITYENYYIETLWWIIKKIYEKKLLYQDYKVVPYCPRCGTPLSSHEVALGYRKIKEESIYVLFKIKGKKNAYFIVWTTTPWTLPANVALAINPDFEYNQQIINGKIFIYFPSDNFIKFIKETSFFSENAGNLNGLKKIKGKELIGLEYEPLYKFLKPDKKAYYVVGADFVSKEEGTGIVHIAPAFGEDDMKVAREYNLPILISVNDKGKFVKKIRPWANKFVKEADPLIIKDLEKRGFLFQKQLIEHEYPFCWRCSTPLLYYAKVSWFIKISSIKNKLIKNNEKINWIPSHIKKGRFGEWLKDIRDWAISRERYWGTPLPIWQCQRCKAQKVIGSIEELKQLISASSNRYFIMRHGRANSNHDGFISCWPEKIKVSLTEEGKKQIEKSILNLKKRIKKIDLIFSSDLLRTKETAQIAAKLLKVKKINFDKRLREIDVGIFNGKKIEEYEAFFENFVQKFKKAPEGGETLKDVQKRIFNFLKEIEAKYKNKNILIISHGDPLRVLRWLVNVSFNVLPQEQKEKEIEKIKDLKTGEIEEIEFKDFSYDENGDLDLHRPYIDKVELICDKCQSKMIRIKDLIDVWFDSGAMPFAQNHWPFSCIKNSKLKTRNIKLCIDYPADFIAEGIDQTRGWFYTLLAISTLLDFGPSYKNVISLGLVLDKYGQKMSKSKGNVINPLDVIEKFGADALRWYFYTINSAGDAKLFNVDDLSEKQRKFLLTLLNSFIYFDIYVVKPDLNLLKQKLSFLDAWIMARLNETVLKTTRLMNDFDLTLATRTIENLVDDLSRWYIRRSRERFIRDSKDKLIASSILYFVLINISKIIAPFVPFFAEYLYQKLKKYEKKPKESVHLCDFPRASEKLIKTNILKKMEILRRIAYLGLKLRAQAKIKVRQPLKEFYFYIPKVKFKEDELDLLKEELNIKKVIFDYPPKNILNEKEGEIEVGLNTEITIDLKNEGMVREIVRNIQELRKEGKLTPKDKIFVTFFSENQEIINLLKQNENFIKEEVLAKQILLNQREKSCFVEKEISLDAKKLKIGINKI